VGDTQAFAGVVLLTAMVGLLAVLSNGLTERVHVPAPVLFLAAAAIAVRVLPGLSPPAEQMVERVVTVALLCILFDGGMHLGWPRFRRSATPIAVLGIVGTFLTAAAASVLAHLAFGLDWYLAALLGTAVSPTDPAVVFSVLGRREIAGRSGDILEGESGANDPVGIALMVALLAAGGIDRAALPAIAGQFALQLGVGMAVGVAGGRGLLWFIRRVGLPAEGLYPLRTLASAFVIYGVATLAHGSGFLAVFIAGIVLGDERAPFKREIERFHSALASLAEIIAFVVLGLTVDLDELLLPEVWVPVVILGAVVALVIRPVLVGLCLMPVKLRRQEKAFILFAGLKGAVPILLASYLLAANIPHGTRLYGIVVVVVVFSVLVQGSLVPTVARALRLPMRTVQPEPWALGVRLRIEPEGFHRFTIAPGSPADGRTVEDLADLPVDAWVSFVVRDHQLLTVRGDTSLQAGDDVLVLADDDLRERLTATFEQAQSTPPPADTE